MTPEQIASWAIEAGWWTLPRILRVRLERFAAIVAAHEREQCALVCEAKIGGGDAPPAGENLARRIRARGTE